MKTTEIIKTFNQKLIQIDFSDKSVLKIHQEFLNFIFAFVDFRLLTRDEIKANQDNLSKISSEIEFVNFCKTSNGIYYKCCLWAKNNLSLNKLTNKDNVICEKHHIECNYMKKYDISKKHFNVINEKYNLVKLTRSLHILIHTIRYLEYKYEDLIFLTFIKPNFKISNINTTTLLSSKNPKQVNDLNQTYLADFLFSQLVQNPDYFMVPSIVREIKIKAGKKGGVQNALNRLDPVINDYLKNTMHWRNKNNNTSLTFKPDRFSILRELVIELNKNMALTQLPENWKTNNVFLTACCTDMKNYLLGTPIIDKRRRDINITKHYYSSSYKKQWYLAEANENDYRLNNIKQILQIGKQPYFSKQPQQVKALLSQNDTFWYNTKYDIGCTGILVNRGEFVNLFDLVYKLLDMLPVEKKPKQFHQFHSDSKIKSRIVQELTRFLVKKNPKIKTFYGYNYDRVSFNNTDYV